MKGCVHIYCGDGKGKTSAALGLALRAAGRGKKVLITRFLKTDDSGEVQALRHIPRITVTPCVREFGFVFRMTDQQKQEAAVWFRQLFQTTCQTAVKEDYDVVIFDELMACVTSNMIPESAILSFLSDRPQNMEVIMTGRNPSAPLLEAADYVSEIHAIKHPYAQGIPAREGIEY